MSGHDWQLHVGDCRDVLRSLPAGSVHTCVTSPPYFGLRDYGNDGQIGLEPTPDEFVAALVDVFREVRRVLRDDGTVWLNLGDSYNADGRKGRAHMGEGKNNGYSAWVNKTMEGTKPKDLLGIPWLVAFALRADGWYLRSDIVWAKPNPMPESVTDRPTKSHEYLFLLSKGPRYAYDADAIRETSDWGRENNPDWQHQRAETNSRKHPTNRNGKSGGFAEWSAERGRNKRSVWTVATQPYPGAHFATFPPKLIEPCILAGAPERACGECGASWARVVERGERVQQHWAPGTQDKAIAAKGRHGATSVIETGEVQTYRTVGFEPSCIHNAEPMAGTVLDPFAGAGTTGVVALRHNRDFVGIELNAEYAELARPRLERYWENTTRPAEAAQSESLF